MNIKAVEFQQGISKNTFFLKVKKLYLKSIKLIQTDEPVVALFFRPVGFLIAVLARSLKLTPNMLSVVRGILGTSAGILIFIGTPQTITIGAIVLVLATFFDVADGQLARITETYSRMGTIFDGIFDGLTVGFVYIATAYTLFRNTPGNGAYWWILCSLASICFLIQLNSFNFLRHEYLFYNVKKPNETRESFSKINKEFKDIDSKKEKKKKKMFILIILMIFNVGFIELASRIVLNKKYKGFHKWYEAENNIPKEKKELFKANYKKYNGWITSLFGNLGLGSNLLVFTISGLFNRLDLGIYTILIFFNIYYLLMVFIQQLSFRIQLKKIGI